MDYDKLNAKLLGDNENTNPLMNRVEDKYLVLRSQLEKLTSTLREHLDEGESDTDARFNHTQTIYLDTKDLDCFRAAIAGIKPRFKVRIRQYAPNGGKFEDVAYLELKIKTESGMTKKTRIRVPRTLVDALAQGLVALNPSEELINLNRDIPIQVLTERLQTIHSTLKKYGFRRQIVVQYERRAYSNDDIRVTVDDHVRYFDAVDLGDASEIIGDTPGFKRAGKLAERVKNTPYVILEIKHRGTVPSWLTDLCGEVNAESVKFSKYATAIVDFARDGNRDGTASGEITKQGLDVSPLIALFHDPVAKSKRKKDLVRVAAVVLRDNNFVLVGKRRKNDKWGLPGGKFEDGESKEEVALRELREETGIKLKKEALIYEGQKTVETDDETKCIYVFSAQHPGGEPTGKNDPDREFSDWQWIRCENGMLPAKILEDKMNKPTSAAFEKMGLSKAESNKVLFYVAVVLMTPEGQVLLGERREDGIWTTPAGGNEYGETPEQTAVREVFEETGMTISKDHLELISVKATPNGKPIHCYLYTSNIPMAASVKHDPDREVHGWDWYSKEMFPAGLYRQKNVNRLETINQAFMKYYGIGKADAEVLSLIDKLDKASCIRCKEPRGQYNCRCGGRCQDCRDHDAGKHEPLRWRSSMEKSDWKETTKNGVRYYINGPHAGKRVGSVRQAGGHGPTEPHPKPKHDPKQFQALVDLSFDMQDKGSDFPVETISHLPDDMKTHARAIMRAADEFHETDEDSPKYAAAEKKLGDATSRFQQTAKLHLERGDLKPPSKLQSHLHMLNRGGVMPGLSTQSGKPVVNDMDAARAHGYDVQDHVDAMNAHYELGQKTQAILEKLKTAGHKVPEEGAKIAQFHDKKMKEHMRARQQLEERKKRVDEAAHPKVSKSTTQMDGGLGDRDVNTGDFAQTNAHANPEWMEKLYSGMQGSDYGDTARPFVTEKGTLYLAKVDDGLYSGYFTKQDSGLEDNARVRIERTTIPELVQFMVAKEWIRNHVAQQVQTPSPAPTPAMPEPEQKNFNEGMFGTGMSLSQPEAMPSHMVPDPMINTLTEKLAKPTDPTDRTVHILELVAKLLG